MSIPSLSKGPIIPNVKPVYETNKSKTATEKWKENIYFEEKEKLEAELERSKKILSNKGFIAKAPKEKIDEEKAKQEKYSTMLEEVNSRLKSLK